MKQIIYSMQFTGKAEPSGESPNVLRARTVAPSCEISSIAGANGIEGTIRTVAGQESTFESQVTLTGESTFHESGTICFDDGRNALRFGTVGKGHMGPSPDPMVNHGSVIWRVESARFAQERSERQRRRELVKADFDLLHEAGFLLTPVSIEHGGLYENVARSTRPMCEMLRFLAHGDSSVALVASMHPAVIATGGWMDITEAPAPFTKAWDEQRRWVFQTACDGHWWGTIISESGSGGDTTKTKAVARPAPTGESYLLSGQKQFGSGSGITSFMITRAIPEGETASDLLFMDMRGLPWAGTAGVTLTAAWDGYGMTATQSHAMTFADMPAVRSAWPGVAREQYQLRFGRPMGHLFTSVIVGIVEMAIETARRQLEPKRGSMRAYEQVEWAKVEMEGWLIQQAYEGVLREAEAGGNAARSGLLCKEAVAGLAESVLLRISKIVGGSAYSRHSPYRFWQEDVRALGFLRPPWGFAFDRIFQGAWGIGA